MIERQDKLRMRRENKKSGLPVSATPLNFQRYLIAMTMVKTASAQ